jgi:hypothetical protein
MMAREQTQRRPTDRTLIGHGEGFRIAVGDALKAAAILVLLAVTGCVPPPRAASGIQEQQARDVEHAQIRQERAQQEYWEWERGGGGRP